VTDALATLKGLAVLFGMWLAGVVLMAAIVSFFLILFGVWF
jgi:hypothetical protein